MAARGSGQDEGGAPMSENYRPTLLVGVGGTGSRIVEAVMREAKATGAAGQGKLAALVFDTDEHDMRRLVGIDPRHRIRFSGPLPVYSLLKANPEVMSWFVEEERLP